MSASALPTLPAPLSPSVARGSQPAAGFAPKSRENAPSGAKLPPFVENRGTPPAAVQSPQLAAAPLVDSHRAATPVETKPVQPTGVLHHSAAAGAEPAEERALIAEGF